MVFSFAALLMLQPPVSQRPAGASKGWREPKSALLATLVELGD